MQRGKSFGAKESYKNPLRRSTGAKECHTEFILCYSFLGTKDLIESMICLALAFMPGIKEIQKNKGLLAR
ncbi:hypothetical protein [Membranihabitans maritimus]|uniref:hypothetical protein n=1 Tax=Membranihabitans maritimus TaxID=2904244 RepID=UPI001F48B612|nr:hypothetical protein [Membranihabitans maritimus]